MDKFDTNDSLKQTNSVDGTKKSIDTSNKSPEEKHTKENELKNVTYNISESINYIRKQENIWSKCIIFEEKY